MYSLAELEYVPCRLCGVPPFYSKTKENLMKKIMAKEIKFDQPIWETVSDAGETLSLFLLLKNSKH